MISTVENIDYLKSIEAIALRLASVEDLRSLIDTVSKIIFEIAPVEYMALYIYDSANNRLKLVSSKGMSLNERKKAEITAMQRHPGRAWAERRLIYIPDEDEESRTFDELFPNGISIKTRLYIPIIRNDECLGTFAISSTKSHLFDDQSIALLSFLTNIAGVIYKNIIDRRELDRINHRMKIANRNFLAQKLHSIGQLAAGIAHELNSPLQYMGDNLAFLNSAYEMMTTFVDSIKQVLESEDVQDKNEIMALISRISMETDIHFFLSEIPPAICQSIEGLDRVSRIVKTMKDFAQSGVKEKSFKNINKSIEDTLLITHNEWKNWAIVTTDLSVELPLIYCQADEINQVLLQIIINSVHAIQDRAHQDKDYKKGNIVITTKLSGESIVIAIEDDGIGIEEHNIQRIFDPFFTTKEAGKGTGQGLAIAHDVVVNKHNGSIKVNSTRFAGTGFTIVLPLSY